MSSEYSPVDESFAALRLVQDGLERLGYVYQPVAREHTEAGVIDPLVHRLRGQIKRRGLDKLAGRVAISFSGYAEDEREVFAIPEIRGYWRRLDRQLPELPALLAYIPELRFNGPGMHLMLLGTIDQTIRRPEMGSYDVHVADALPLIKDAARRIQQAGRTYRLRADRTERLIEQFLVGATHRTGQGL